MGKAEEYKSVWYSHINDLYRLGWNLEIKEIDKLNSIINELIDIADIAYQKELKGEK